MANQFSVRYRSVLMADNTDHQQLSVGTAFQPSASEFSHLYLNWSHLSRRKCDYLLPTSVVQQG